MSKSPKSAPSLPHCLAVVGIGIGASGVLRGPLSYVIVFAVVFGGLLCLRAVVRAKAKGGDA